MISLEQWRALVAVVDAGGYAKASAVLNKSQSAVTYAVQTLESRLGVRAFEIRGRKAALTPTGELLVRRARALLEEADALERVGRTLSAGWEAEIGLAAEIVFPSWLLLKCLERFGAESPHTRIEVVESVLGGTAEALVRRQVDLAISGAVPPGFLGEPLMLLRFVLVAHPAHALHRLGRALTLQDLRVQRQLVVRESGSTRATRPSLEATQRWTVGHLATSLEAVRAGYGYAWLPEERIRDELAQGTLRPLPMREGGLRFAQLYLIFADRDAAGPGARRLAQIIHEATQSECPQAAASSVSG